MYIKFLNYAPKKIIFKINLIINPLCIQLNMSVLYKCFRYNCSNRNLYLTLSDNFSGNKLNQSFGPKKKSSYEWQNAIFALQISLQ